MRASTYVYLVNPLQQGNGRKKDLATSHKRTQPDPSSLLPSITHLPLQNPTQANPTCQIPHTLLGTCTYLHLHTTTPTHLPQPQSEHHQHGQPKAEASTASYESHPPTYPSMYIHTYYPNSKRQTPTPDVQSLPFQKTCTPDFGRHARVLELPRFDPFTHAT